MSNQTIVLVFIASVCVFGFFVSILGIADAIMHKWYDLNTRITLIIMFAFVLFVSLFTAAVIALSLIT